MKEGKIGFQEGFCAVMLSVLLKEIFIKQFYKFQVSNNSWIAEIIATMLTLLIFLVAVRIIEKTDSQDLQEAFEKSVGKKLSSIFIFIYFLISFADLVYLIAECAMIIKSYIFIRSPNGYITAILCAVVGVCAFLGLEAVSRASKMFLIVTLLALGIVVIFISDNFVTSNLFPLLGEGIDGIIFSGIRRFPFYIDTIALLLVGKAFYGIKFTKRIGVSAISFAGIVTAVVFLGVSLTYSYTTLDTMISPFYQVLGMMDIGKYYQRLEDLLFFVIMTGLLVAGGFSLYCSANIYCKAFSIKDIRPVIISISLLLYCCVYVLGLNVQWIEVIDWYYYRSLSVFYVLPIIISVIAIKKKSKKNAKSIKCNEA